MLCFREIWSAAKQKRAAHVSILLYMIHVFCVCMYVCNMYVCEHGVPQNIIIIIITIIIIIIMIMIMIIIVIVIVIIISRSSFFKYGTWWSTTGFFGTPFSNKLYLYGRMCVVCVYMHIVDFIDIKICRHRTCALFIVSSYHTWLCSFWAQTTMFFSKVQ